jgi:hypothetical protein
LVLSLLRTGPGVLAWKTASGWIIFHDPLVTAVSQRETGRGLFRLISA